MTEEERWAVSAWLAAYEHLDKKMTERGVLYITRNDLVSLIQEMRRALDNDSRE